MIVSERDPGAFCIPQSQHAAICGQMATAWGNERFAIAGPWTEVCLAAACHDDGMDDFDAAPELDPDTGLPRDFMRMPLDLWLDCWRRGPALAAERHSYAGILVSMHGEHLLGYRRLDDDPAGRVAADRWLAEQRSFREGLIEQLRGDLALGGHTEPAALERNRALLAAWDAMSLALCVPRLPQEIGSVPAGGGDGGAETTLSMRESAADPGTVLVDPWPFATDRLTVSAHGRRLDRRFADEAEMRAALASAKPEPLELTLVPSPE